MNITYLAQKALSAWLRAQTFTNIPDTQIYTGFFNTETGVIEGHGETIELPCVVCGCDDAMRKEFNTGNWNADAFVAVWGGADDTAAEDHHDNATEVFATLFTDSIASDLSAALSGFVVNVVKFTHQRSRINGRKFISELHFTLDCSANDVT